MHSFKYSIQVSDKHYSFEEYVTPERWISYYHQISSIRKVAKLLKKKNISILEIGIGDGLVTTILRHLGYTVTTFDMDLRLKPDILSVLPNINLNRNKKFDCILCSEVLEHLDYSDVELALTNMAKYGKYVVISVPNKSVNLSIKLKAGFAKPFKLLFSIPAWFWTHKFMGEHYWELQTRQTHLAKFKKSLTGSNLKLLTDFRDPDNYYHHFFICKSLINHD